MSESQTIKRWQGFIVRANGQVDELAEDGETERWWTGTDLYEQLLLAGYPLSGDTTGERWDGIFDVSVDPDDLSEVTAYTTGQFCAEHKMGAASEVFLRWYAEHVL